MVPATVAPWRFQMARPKPDVMRDELITLLDGRRGHFQMESGYHSEQWFALDSLFEDRARLQPFAAELARRLKGK